MWWPRYVPYVPAPAERPGADLGRASGGRGEGACAHGVLAQPSPPRHRSEPRATTAQNAGPWPNTRRCASSWTTTVPRLRRARTSRHEKASRRSGGAPQRVRGRARQRWRVALFRAWWAGESIASAARSRITLDDPGEGRRRPARPARRAPDAGASRLPPPQPTTRRRPSDASPDAGSPQPMRGPGSAAARRRRALARRGPSLAAARGDPVAADPPFALAQNGSTRRHRGPRAGPGS